jgi:hypothetical protein
MQERVVTEAERYELARTAIGMVRAARDGDEAGFAVLAGSIEDPWLLVGMLAQLGAQLIDASSPDPARTLSMLATFAVEQAPS